jgi:hypothetical protein
MKSLKRWLFFVLFILSPLIISAAFIFAGHPDENGRYSLSGETTSTPEGYKELLCESQRKIAEGAAEALGTEVPQDGSSGCEASNKELAQMGAATYYKLDVSSPSAFYNAANGRGFNEGYGMQCVAAFKEFMFSLSGKYVATSTGGASGYASQRSQIEALGFTWYSGASGLQNGDWGIFGGGTYGHVAMYYNGKWFGQNQGAANANVGNAFNLIDLGSYANTIIGYYRPNIYKKSASTANTSTPTPSNSSPSSTGTAYTPPSSYTVRSGDTLGGISLNNGWWSSTTGLYGDAGYAQRLAERNGLSNRGLVYPNQTIRRAE